MLHYAQRLLRGFGPAGRVQLNSIGASDSQAGATSSASATFTTAGLCDLTGNGSIPDFNWKLSAEAASAFDIMVTVSAGAFNSGTVGSWLNLGTQRAWSLSRTTAGGAAVVSATVQIRDASTLAVLAGPSAFNFDVDSGA